MNDMSSTIVAKSDQINAADLIGNPRTIVIREVRIKAGDDQPVSVLIEGDNKAFRPCKGVRRLMVRVWGADASKYVGQAMTLFCDPGVTWAGKEEGGIRVSHMTGLAGKIVEFMRTSRAATKPYEILPLKSERAEPKKPRKTADEWATDHIAFVTGAASLERLAAVQLSGKPSMDKLGSGPVFDRVTAAYAKRLSELSPAIDDDDPFEPATGRADTDHGDQFDDTDAQALRDAAAGRVGELEGK